MSRRKRRTEEDPRRGRTPAGAEGAAVLGEGRPAGEEVLGEAELPDPDTRMDRMERTAEVPPPGPATEALRRKRASRRRAAEKEKEAPPRHKREAGPRRK